ncbi:hypothetical protein ABIE41_003863 [Bosea sp. OAE506]|uniref:head-tail joining protein n=1 Tax=Bosea sp. OAE506 TaxID=2663870 RepID=UPI00178B72EC
MSAFDALDAMVLDTAQRLFGDTVTLYPMKPGAAGVNAKPVADASRAIVSGLRVIRSEWSERVQIGGQGLPTPPGQFRQAAAGVAAIATFALADLPWRPQKGDELVYADRPGERWRIVEPMPDGLSGLHCGLARL